VSVTCSIGHVVALACKALHGDDAVATAGQPTSFDQKVANLLV